MNILVDYIGLGNVSLAVDKKNYTLLCNWHCGKYWSHSIAAPMMNEYNRVDHFINRYRCAHYIFRKIILRLEFGYTAVGVRVHIYILWMISYYVNYGCNYSSNLTHLRFSADLGWHPTNKRHRYKVAPSLIGLAQTWNQPWGWYKKTQVEFIVDPMPLVGMLLPDYRHGRGNVILKFHVNPTKHSCNILRHLNQIR